MNIKAFYYTGIILLGFSVYSSCKKEIEVAPPENQLSTSVVFNNSRSADAAILGVYSNIMYTGNLLNFYISSYGGLLADELVQPLSDNEFSANQIDPMNMEIERFWDQSYFLVYSANAVIENLRNSPLSEDIKKQLTGEAKFLRAFVFFYLTNLWQDVPLVLSTDYRINAKLPQSGSAAIYTQIIADLTDAINTLPDQQVNGYGRATKWAAKAFLARVYLFNGNWKEAEKESTDVISSGLFALEADLNSVFLAESAESILQLEPVVPGYNTFDSQYFIADAGIVPPYVLSNELLMAFDTLDARREAWIQSTSVDGVIYYYPAKYKNIFRDVVSEDYVVLRLAELYLIRAEARSIQDHIPEALDDLNAIRERAGLLPAAATSAEELLTMIDNERRLEFFAECGHRWFDLKRRGLANTVLSVIKPATWQPSDVLWPIPQQQININDQLKQNSGY